jgi:hypothetical protein
MGNYSAPARRVEVLDIDPGERAELLDIPLTKWDLCDSSAVGSEAAAVRFVKGGMSLDLCDHHAFVHGADLLSDGWTDASAAALVTPDAATAPVAASLNFPLGQRRTWAAPVADDELPGL